MPKPAHSDAKHPAWDNMQKSERSFILLLRKRTMFSASTVKLRHLQIPDFYKSGF